MPEYYKPSEFKDTSSNIGNKENMSIKSNSKQRYDRPKSGYIKSVSYELILECLQNCVN